MSGWAGHSGRKKWYRLYTPGFTSPIDGGVGSTLKEARENARAAIVEKLKLPTDREVLSLVSSLWFKGLNREALNIALCLSSKLKVDPTEAFIACIELQLKRLVKEEKLTLSRSLPGRPFYNIS